MNLYPWLTRDVRKRALYAGDPFMRVALAEAQEVGLESDAVAARASILFKPDAVARRLVEPALAHVARRGFEPFWAEPVVLDAARSHALWWYQWNRATPDRLRLAELFGQQGPSLLVLLRSRPAALPATVRLSALKGPADRERRQPSHLREQLGMRNRMLSLIHCPDEPADLIRDLTILLPPDRRMVLWKRLFQDSARKDNLSMAIAALYAESVAHDLDPSEVCHRRHIDPAILQRKFRLDDYAELFGPTSTDGDTWDFITTAAEVIDHILPNVDPLLSSMDYQACSAAWRRKGPAEKRWRNVLRDAL